MTLLKIFFGLLAARAFAYILAMYRKERKDATKRFIEKYKLTEEPPQKRGWIGVPPEDEKHG